MSEQSYQQAQKLLLEQNQISDSVLNKTFAHIARHSIDYADLYFQHSLYETWFLEEGIVKSGSFNIAQGVGVRAVSADKTALAYSDQISEQSLIQAATHVRAIGSTGTPFEAAITKPINRKPLFTLDNPINSKEAIDKIQLLHKIEQQAKAQDSRVIQVMAGLTCEYDTVFIARLDGKRAADIRPLIHLSIHVIVSQNGKKEQASGGIGGRYTLDYFDDEKVEHQVHKIVQQALTNLEAKPAPAGQMTVVLGNGWPGVLLHEAIGHGLEGDFNRKGTSAFSKKMGQRVAAKGVTIVDNGSIANRRGSLTVDDEGNLTQATTLIEDGVLVGYLQDEMNARLMGSVSTGNGRRESYACTTMPRMTNTYMENGQYEPAEIIASVKDGIFASNFGGGQVDITNGKFVFSASEAWKIENGKLVYPIKGATLIGDGPDVLNYVSMIGHDLALDSGIGVCGKEGQSVPVGVGQPTLRIDGGLTVGGSEL
ncbi:metalloprotease TldD [Neisseria sp. Ec49-e6-T10]|uniref:metalloprotease TldD n=1 Tax=Neisseria sp. Ec49-e6-T10 TaxID=3140744 RepID=UPI003EBD5730